ncbi:aldose epimerase family protein [Leptodesmis sichuanensis]|uniref:aldose epimerase family protein n=1 Tax=Leptodesmis sichuanensis TaxID=2906798 RepID=UPI001F4895C7|nr:aldose epimerase [Leptodesmis sichuanensis]UIE37155.1 aldose epimerase [Leptodesmis sichuanensis A121]
MFKVTIADRQYRTYILADEAGQSCLEVVPERGGMITRWQVQGQDILYLDAERFADPTLTVRGGVPILFPICGNLPDNQYHWQGKIYHLKQHGFARDLPWTVVDQSAAQQARLTLELVSTEETRRLYPFDFQLLFTYRLQGDRLTLHQTYTNRSADPMPFSAGFHPYFAVQHKGQLQFQIPASEFQDQRTKTVHSFSGQFDFEQDEIDVAFMDLSSPVATVTDPTRSQRLILSFSPEFSLLVFWTLKEKAFYCLEPWTAGRNAMNTGDRLLHLDPGQSLETEFTLQAKFG